MLTVRKRPCPSCPYRLDVPSGIWAADEYAKLPLFDGETFEQAAAGAFAPFSCHSSPELLCAGWVGTHDMAENLALRFAARRGIDPAVYDYVSPVPLFGSGAEAAAHGMRDLERPGADALRAAAKLRRIVAARYRDAADLIRGDDQ